MPINTIHIENYKSIKKIENFQMSRVNILIGPNGSGKSNFISFFKFLRKIYEQNLAGYVKQNGGAIKFLYGGIKGSEYIRGKITFDNDWKNEYEFLLKPTANNDFYFEYEYSNHKISKIKINEGGTKESVLKNDGEYRNKYLSRHFESFKVFHFHDTGFTSKMRFPSFLSDNQYLQEEGSNLPTILYKIRSKNKEDYDTIVSTVQTVLPYFHDFYLEPDNDHIALRWKVVNEDVIFDAHQLSDGSIRFIALTTLLLQPQPPQVIIIDEPELGLHPYAINQLTQMINIASQKSQIIISTQSSDLIDAYIANSSDIQKAVESIIITEYQDNQTQLKRLNFNKLKQWLDDYSLSELWHKNILGGKP